MDQQEKAEKLAELENARKAISKLQAELEERSIQRKRLFEKVEKLMEKSEVSKHGGRVYQAVEKSKAAGFECDTDAAISIANELRAIADEVGKAELLKMIERLPSDAGDLNRLYKLTMVSVDYTYKDVHAELRIIFDTMV